MKSVKRLNNLAGYPKELMSVFPNWVERLTLPNKKKVIEKVFLFDAQSLTNELKLVGAKMGIATSVQRHLWENAEIYPTSQNDLFQLSQVQRDALALFRLKAGANTACS